MTETDNVLVEPMTDEENLAFYRAQQARLRRELEELEDKKIAIFRQRFHAFQVESRTYEFVCSTPCRGETCRGHYAQAHISSEATALLEVWVHDRVGEDEPKVFQFDSPQFEAMRLAVESGMHRMWVELRERARELKPPKYAYVLNGKSMKIHLSLDGGKTGRDARCQISRIEKRYRKRCATRAQAERLGGRPCPLCMPKKRQMVYNLGEEETSPDSPGAIDEHDLLGVH